MQPLICDTTREADEVQRKILRAMPAWRKLDIAFGLNRTLRELVLANAGELSRTDRLRLLANRWVGPELAAAAYSSEPGQS